MGQRNLSMEGMVKVALAHFTLHHHHDQLYLTRFTARYDFSILEGATNT